MTTLHKIDDKTLIMTCSDADQYIISNQCVEITCGVDTSVLEAVPFDITISAMLDNAQHTTDRILDAGEIAVLQNFAQDKIEAFE